MAVMKELSIERDILNINGGACALGHPVGASGARIVATLINNLKNKILKKVLPLMYRRRRSNSNVFGVARLTIIFHLILNKKR